jgi:hypothetical protein
MAGRLDQTRPFLPVNIALLTVSDTRSMADDRSGNTDLAARQYDGHDAGLALQISGHVARQGRGHQPRL